MKNKKGLAKLDNDFITENITELQRYHQAFLFEKVFGMLSDKGFTFSTPHDVKMFFKNRLKQVNYENGQSILVLDDNTPLCSYRMPIFKETDVVEDKHEISIGFQFVVL